MRRRTLIGLLAVLIAASGASGADAATKPASPKRQVAKAFTALTKDTRALPKRSLSRHNRRALVRIANRARRQARRNPCKAIKTLNRYRRGLRRVKQRRFRSTIPSGGSARGKLQSDVLAVNVALMALPKAKRCGGGKRAAVTQSTSTVVESDERHLRLKVTLPAPTFVARQVGDTQFQQMFMEGTGETGDQGKPGLPQMTDFYGIPNGATASFKLNGTQGYDLHGVDLFPHQPSSQDLALPPGAPDASTFADKPFEIDAKSYKSDAKFPPTPSDAQGVGSFRSLSMGGVDFAGGQYQPKSNTLHVFTSIDVTITFGGDNKGTFGDGNDIASPWTSYIAGNYSALAKNWDTIIKHLGPIHPVPSCGHDMLIVTSAELAPAAETLRAAKQAQGYSPLVKLTSEIGTTNTAISSYIHTQLLDDCLVPLQYVILLGNTAHVPTFLVPCGPGGNVDECNIASDLPYSLSPASLDLFADVELGRIPAIDLAGANATVAKIVNYENTPPAPPGDDFYHHATATGYFQPAWHCVINEGESGTPNCNEEAPPVTGHWEIDYANHTDTRGFTKYSDGVIRALEHYSYTADRLWTTDDEDVQPEFYYDGTPIPTSLRRPAQAWDANTTDFLNAYNGGRFLILHRDHGWPDGWADPTLHSGHVPGFTNGTKLPVVFGVNCSSAAFDTPTHPSFVELQVERPDGGAVAGFGDTRVSPSFPNNHMTYGFFDALFPDLVPTFGSAVETRRLGDVLVRGKQYMASQEGIDWQGAGDTYVEHYLYHLLGDPSLQMWAAPPTVFDPRKIFSRYIQLARVNPGDPGFEIQIRFPVGGGEPPAFGTVATVFSHGDAVGRGVVGGDGTVTIRPDIDKDADLSVSFQQDGALPAQDTVDDAPQPTPAPQKQQTSLTLVAPGQDPVGGQQVQFTGQLSPGFAGAAIKIEYKNIDRPNASFTDTVTTLKDGSYSDNVTFPITPPDEDWTAQATYAGDTSYLGSQSPLRRFVVSGNN